MESRRSAAGRDDTSALSRFEDELFARGPVVCFEWENRARWPVCFVSPNVAEVLGVCAEEFYRGELSYADLIHGDDIERVAAEVAEYSGSGAAHFVHHPYRLLHRDGRILTVLDYTTIRRNDAGEITHYIGYIVDITEQRRVAHQLEEQLRFSRALNRIADAILAEADAEGLLDTIARLLGTILETDRALIYDICFDRGVADGLCEWINPACAGITPTRASYPLQMFRGGVEFLRRTKSWLESHDHSPHPSLMEDGSVDTLHGEMRIRSLLWYPFFFRDNGYYLLVLNQVREGRDWKPEEFVFLDAVTRQVNLALQKLELLDELQQTQNRLVRRERMAAVGQLSAGIAHDFNNILTAILGVTELLEQRGDLPAEVCDNLRLVSASGRRAARLVRQLLDFSRRTVRQPRVLDLRELCRDTVAFLQRILPETIDVELVTTPDEMLVDGDRVQLQEVLTNLVVNSRDAMPMGGRIEIRTERLSAVDEASCAICGATIRGEWIHLQCRDSGTGIADHHIERVFEPFFSTKQAGEGAGLGLAQVAGIVGQHDGHLTVSSEPGKGTTFSLYLPPLDHAGPEPRSESQPTTTQGRGERILVVEDDPIVRRVTAAMLESQGYTVNTAPGGRQALERISREDFSLVLSDMVMPDMDGLALLRQLRTARPNLRLVMMSGYPLGDESRELVERGEMCFIQKPVGLPDLCRVIRSALDAD